MFRILEFSFLTTKSKYVMLQNRSKLQTEHLVSPHRIGISHLNLCFVKRSGSRYLLVNFSFIHFLQMLMTNFSSHENIPINKNFCFLSKTALAQSLNCFAVTGSKNFSIAGVIELFEGVIKTSHYKYFFEI